MGNRRLWFCEGVGKRFDEGADFIAHSAVVRERFFLGLCVLSKARRIVETDVNDFCVSGEYRAGFVGVVADGDDVIEGDGGERVDVLGLAAGDIDAGFGHCPHGSGVHAVGIDAGGIRLDHVALEESGPAFGHLAAAGIASAEKEDFEFVGHRFSGAAYAYTHIVG